jgi:hypothetical protein
MERWRYHKRATWRILDGRAVVVGGSAGRLYILNSTGTCLWEALKETATLEGLANKLAERFSVEISAARADTSRFVNQMVDKELLEAV